jgi:two-component system chemotaxis response regulator CheY
MKVLIVDDIKTNRRVLRLILSEISELEFSEAENGVLAVQKAVEEKPDIIFMDIMMPEMDGITATSIIKNEKKLDSFIYGITALDDNNIKSKMVNAGASDFIYKPFNDEELLARVRQYIKLIKSRQSSNKEDSRSQRTICLFDDELVPIRVTFQINNESSLIVFMDYFEKNITYKQYVNDAMMLIVTISTALLEAKKVDPFDIVFEEGEKGYYFTIWNKVFVKGSMHYFTKFSNESLHVVENDKITIMSPKGVRPEEFIPIVVKKRGAQASSEKNYGTT